MQPRRLGVENLNARRAESATNAVAVTNANATTKTIAVMPQDESGGQIVGAPTSPSAVTFDKVAKERDSGAEAEVSKMRVLVVGGTGVQGSAVVRQLLAAGRFKVIVMTRNPDTPQTAALREQDVTVVKGDMDDPLGLDRAFGIASGAMPGVHPTPGALHGVFCVVNYWLPSPDAQREILQAKNVVNAAKRASVRHFIYSSIAGAASDNGPFHRRAGDGTGIPHWDSKLEVEEHLMNTGLRYTIVRSAPNASCASALASRTHFSHL
eukprot:SAG31_NODE_2957_length_4857_cov_47.100883_4_plen_266_part_00